MAGKNLFERVSAFGIKSSEAAEKGPCVFISHRKADKVVACEVATSLMQLGVNIYFDEHDAVLSQARELEDPKKVVKCIEDGLDNCSHLLGIITDNTRGSWWVPYEIGGAKGRGRECAYLITKQVTELPAYICIARLLPDMDSLNSWVPSSLEKFATASAMVLLEKVLSTYTLSHHLPKARSVRDFSFF